MSKSASSSVVPSPIVTTVLDAEVGASCRFVWVVFAPVRVLAVCADQTLNRPVQEIHQSPYCCCARISLKRFQCQDIRRGDRIELVLVGKCQRPFILRVARETREASHA